MTAKPNYGIDAPAVLRNLFLIGGLCLALSLFGPRMLHVRNIALNLRTTFDATGGVLLFEGLLFLFYVKVGKFRHRDMMLSLHLWHGDEQVLDVGCGRGLLLVAAAKCLNAGGHATGIDIWSNVDMGGNSAEATARNLALEGVADRCTLLSQSAAGMTFPDASFDVILSNLCIHNIYDRPTRLRALHEIVRVLRPGGIALISDYKLTREYATEFRNAGLRVETRHGSLLATFPPLNVVIARKPSA